MTEGDDACAGHSTETDLNSASTRSSSPETVATGVPNTAREHRDGAPVPPGNGRRTLTIGWFGTSVMEHLEASNAQMVNQVDLPAIGSSVTVERWCRRGYVHRVHLALQAEWPHLFFDMDNRGEGGATSRDIVGIVAQVAAEGRTYDIAFLGCAINDVWRSFQGRTAEAVDLDEYQRHYTSILSILTSRARHVVCIAETPFGPIDTPSRVAAMNVELARYNTLAARAARQGGALFLDVWQPFVTAAQHLVVAPAGRPVIEQSLWSDGLHLSELGDALMVAQVDHFLRVHQLIQELQSYERHERINTLYDRSIWPTRPQD